MLQHLIHHVDFNIPWILGSENDTARLLILESWFIQEQTPDHNNDSQYSPPANFYNQSAYARGRRRILSSVSVFKFQCHIMPQCANEICYLITPEDNTA